MLIEKNRNGSYSVSETIAGFLKTVTYYDYTRAEAKQQFINAVRHGGLMGCRIEIPVHYDRWMQGARFGKVTGYRNGKPGQSDYLLVKMEHPQVKRCVKVWRRDWPYVKSF